MKTAQMPSGEMKLCPFYYIVIFYILYWSRHIRFGCSEASSLFSAGSVRTHNLVGHSSKGCIWTFQIHWASASNQRYSQRGRFTGICLALNTSWLMPYWAIEKQTSTDTVALALACLYIIGRTQCRELSLCVGSGVWGRVLVASLTLACAMRGDRDSNPGPSGHRR